MNQFEVTLQNLATYKTVTIDFPSSEDEVAEAIAEVTNYGQNDYEIVDYEADFKIDFFNFKILQEIAEMKEEQYQAFLVFAENETMTEAVSYANHYNYRMFTGVEDMGDVAHQILELDYEFQEAPEFMRTHFDYDSYGETLCAGGTWYECPSRKTIIELF
jgi:glutamate-1-semialdehyde aminotransferase